MYETDNMPKTSTNSADKSSTVSIKMIPLAIDQVLEKTRTYDRRKRNYNVQGYSR